MGTILLVTAACGGPTTSEEAAGTVTVLGSSVEREDPGDIDVDSVVDSDTAFALSLFRTLREDSPHADVFVSPSSIGTALAMTSLGAQGETAREMQDVLGGSGDAWHRARNALDRQITAPRESTGDGDPLQLTIENSVWGQSGFELQRPFLDDLATHYGAPVRTLDFVTDPEAARSAVNQWVADQTDDLIADLLPEGSVSSDTRLVLTNAVHLDAPWATSFRESATAPADFTTADGDVVSVPMMRTDLETSAGAGDGWQAARLRYRGGASMLVVVPDEGRFDEVADGLDAAMLTEVRASLEPVSLALWMPRFEITSAMSLPPVLESMGIVDAFDPERADFSAMSDEVQLYISDVIHQATVSVDESGTEAAAATGVVVGELSSAPAGPPSEIVLDRPFLFLIHDDATGAILFIGQLAAPAEVR
ncbi:MAG: serpin family protein [Acidimicrobiales bacterium]